MDIFDSLYSSDIETARIVVGINPHNQKDIAFFIGQAGSAKHEKCQRKYSKALEKARKNYKQREIVLIKIVAESILEDWENVTDENGNEISCTLENKIKSLTKYRRMFLEVMEAASDPSNFQNDEDMEDSDEDPISPEQETEKN